MEKKKAIKIAMATAIAASAFTAVAPAQSEAATSLTAKISAAKATIKKPYDTYIKATTKPASLTTIKKQITAAKVAQQDINTAIKKSNLTKKQKTAKYAEIKAYDKYITRAQDYVNAVSINVKSARTAFDNAILGGKAKSVFGAQTALNANIAQFERAVAKVYGKNTRSLLMSYYATPAKKQAVSVNAELKVYNAYQQIESKNLIETNLDLAGKLIESVKAEVEALKAKDTTLAKNLVAAAEEDNAAYEAALAPVVKSVDAVNTKTIIVTFSQPVDAKTLKDATDKDVITVVASNGATNPGTVTQELSTDGKTLTLKASNLFKGEYTVKVPFEIVKDVTGKYVSPINKKVTVNDTTAPVLTSAVSTVKDTKDGIKKITLAFDEEVTTIDTVKIGGANYNADVQGNTATVAVDLDGTKSYDVTVVNATDAAGNVKDVQVAPLSVSVDNVAPSITKVEATGENTVKVTLDEALNADTLTLTGKVGTFTTNIVKDVQVNPVNKKEYTVTLDNNYLFKNGNTDTVTLTVAKDALADALGNTNATEINKTVVVSKDAAAPQVVKVQTSATDGKVTAFSVTYNEEITSPNTAKISVVNAKGEILVPSNVVAKAEVSATDAKTVIFTLADNLAADQYSFDLAEGFVQDKALTANNSATYAFSVDVTDAAKPVATSFAITDASVADNKITVNFGEKVKATGAGSALNPSAYQINGVVLPSDSVLAFAKDGSGNIDQTKVEITLPTGFIKTSDSAAIFRVTGVQTLDNKVSAPFMKTIAVTDNTAPEVQSIVATDLTKLTVTYSEAIALADNATITDEIALTDSKGATIPFTAATVVDGKLVLTVADSTAVKNLTTLKVVDPANADIKDATGNAQKANLTVSQ